MLEEFPISRTAVAGAIRRGPARSCREGSRPSARHADELADPQARAGRAQCRLHLEKNRPDLADRYGRKRIGSGQALKARTARAAQPLRAPPPG